MARPGLLQTSWWGDEGLAWLGTEWQPAQTGWGWGLERWTSREAETEMEQQGSETETQREEC